MLQVVGKSKLKKSFCEPGNVAFNPSISIAEVFAFAKTGSLTIHRPPDSGGDKTYTTVDELKGDHASEALHPGDLKAAVTPLIMSVLESLAKAMTADNDIKQSVKTLKNYQKKASKAAK